MLAITSPSAGCQWSSLLCCFYCCSSRNCLALLLFACAFCFVLACFCVARYVRLTERVQQTFGHFREAWSLVSWKSPFKRGLSLVVLSAAHHLFLDISSLIPSTVCRCTSSLRACAYCRLDYLLMIATHGRMDNSLKQWEKQASKCVYQQSAETKSH